ncbi:hypothetical protein FGG08_002315 [Glutinoglossum americanum]|uniref:Uncharacterized protein n=1 Tax=Glutinoglossum americanum TaxID=1670608 RepID=A0A9P8I9J2_9PEZI|nr:hypothetical protein FGG08_002315 [Glutinoglossum americanum]
MSRISSGTGSLNPTYFGHVATTNDALVLFEACLQGQLHHVPRRPHDRERSALIRSGCVFIYEENASGIKRWTDGVAWSPSRILGNFLVYRELEKPFPPGEKKKATKRDKRLTKPGEPYPSPRSNLDGGDGSLQSYSPMSPTSPAPKSETFDKETERSLIGSLVDSYGFREGGLVKKTMSVNVNGVHHHLVSYYKVEDVLGGLLDTPSISNALRYIKPRLELTSKQNFRAPIDDSDEIREGALDGSQMPYNYPNSGPFDRRTSRNGQGYQLPQPQPHPPPQIGYSYPGTENFSPYGSDTHQASSVPSSYGIGATAPSSVPHAYYGQASRNPSHGQIKVDDYSPYSTSAPYASAPNRLDPLAADGGGISTSAPGRGIGVLQAMDYSQHQLRPIPMTMESSDPLASKPPSGYGRGYQPVSTTGPYQSSIPSMTSRPENAAGYNPDKGAYWPMSGNVASGHGHYPGSSSMQHWTSTA